MQNKPLENALAFLSAAVNMLRTPELVKNPDAQRAIEHIAAAYVAIEAFNKEAVSTSLEWPDEIKENPEIVEAANKPRSGKASVKVVRTE